MQLVILFLLLAGCAAREPLSRSMQYDAERRAADEYLERAARQPGAERTASGSVVRIVEPGAGRRPQASETVTFRYRASLLDGKVIDSTDSRPVAPTVAIESLTPCFAEALQRMSVGAKGRATCREDLVFGERAPRGVVPGSAMIVDLELVDVGKPLPPPGH